MEQLLSLTTVQAVVMTGAVVAGVEIVKQIVDILADDRAREPGAWRTVAIIIMAGVVGGALGVLYLGVPFVEGMVYGLSASGVLNTLQNVGKNGGAGTSEV